MKINTPHEDAVRPGYEVVAARLTAAREELAKAERAVREAEAKLNAHEGLAESEAKKPKNWAHDLAELQATATWAEKRRAAKKQELAEAEREHEVVSRALALARIEDRAEMIAAFDRDEFASRYQAKLAPIADEAWAEIHALKDAETEIRQIAAEAGIDNSEPRYTDLRDQHLFDDINLDPTGAGRLAMEAAFRMPEDPRVVEGRRKYEAEQAAKREAEAEERRRAKEAFEQFHAIETGRAEPHPLNGDPRSAGRPMVTRDRDGNPLPQYQTRAL